MIPIMPIVISNMTIRDKVIKDINRLLLYVSSVNDSDVNDNGVNVSDVVSDSVVISTPIYNNVYRGC